MVDAAEHPLETDAKGIVALPEHVAGEYSVGGCAVSLDRVGRLRVAHSDEGCADGNNLLTVEENYYSFGFCGGSHDGADGLTFWEYRTIRGWSGEDVG